MRWLLLVVSLAACSSHTEHGDLAEPADGGADLSDISDLAIISTDMAHGGSVLRSPLAAGQHRHHAWDAAPGETPVTRLRFTGGRGTITFDGTALPAVAYQKIVFGAFTLAAIAATSDDGVLIAYVYCQNDTVNAIYA